MEEMEEIRKDTEILKEDWSIFTATLFLFSGWKYVLIGSTVAQLFVIMYTLFLVFCSFKKWDTENYTPMCVF
jgi:hypothetical protein